MKNDFILLVLCLGMVWVIFQFGLEDDHCKAIHVQLAMMLSMLHSYNASSQLVDSVKSTFVESPNAREVMQVRMVNPFQLNDMEIQGFPSAA